MRKHKAGVTRPEEGGAAEQLLSSLSVTWACSNSVGSPRCTAESLVYHTACRRVCPHISVVVVVVVVSSINREHTVLGSRLV